ncbi:MAG TPA: peptidase S8, partial [Rugosimonospora sp.]|nr:peptidase S8 [Rugosimonospora sp.]
MTRATIGSAVAAALVGAWSVLVGAALPALAWVTEQVTLVEEVPRPVWLWPLAGWLAAVLIGVPAALLTRYARVPGIRAAGRAWALAALLLGVLGSARVVPTQQNDAYLALFTLVALLAAVPLRHSAPDGPGRAPDSGWALGLIAGLVSLLPWLLLGALGGPLETALAAAAALAAGRLAA